MDVNEKAQLYLTRLKEKGVRYWLWVAIFIAVSTTGSSYVYEYLHLQGARSALFQALLDHGPRPPEPKFVKIVLIEDDEYWSGEPAGRRPIKRTYLAKLVEKLAAAKSHVIALDFDLRSPNPASTDIPREYEDETLKLIEAITDAANRGTKIVLATPIYYDGRGYRQDADPYQAYGLCRQDSVAIPKDNLIKPALAKGIRANRKNITCGYIYLPDDPLVIPSRLQLGDKSELDSFALAVAKAGWPDMKSVRELGSSIRYANFISEHKLRDPKAPILFSANALLGYGTREEENAVKAAIGARPTAVLVGANWSTYAAGRGPRVDLHHTPVGPIVGAMLHANFVEAILDTRLFLFVSERMLHALEIAFGIVVAIVLALSQTTLTKIVNFFLLCGALLLIQWSALHGFAIFFDAYVPLLGLALHSLSERLVAVHSHTGEKVAPTTDVREGAASS